MKLFNRNNPVDVPTEIKEYYQSEHRERVGVAWLLAVVTLIVTVGIILGLFFGGRYVYRKLAQHTTPAKVSQSVGKNIQSKPQKVTSPTPSSGSASASNPSATPTPASSGGQVSSSAATTSEPTSDATRLANTGPTDTLALFMIATVLGIGLYQLRLRFGTKTR